MEGNFPISTGDQLQRNAGIAQGHGCRPMSVGMRVISVVNSIRVSRMLERVAIEFQGI